MRIIIANMTTMMWGMALKFLKKRKCDFLPFILTWKRDNYQHVLILYFLSLSLARKMRYARVKSPNQLIITQILWKYPAWLMFLIKYSHLICVCCWCCWRFCGRWKIAWMTWRMPRNYLNREVEGEAAGKFNEFIDGDANHA